MPWHDICSLLNYMGLQLAKLLVGEGLVSIDQVRGAVEEQRNSGRGLGDSLVTLGHITETDFLGFLGKYYGMPVVDLDSRSVEPEVLKLIPQGTAAEECLIPVSLVGADLIVAVSDPSNILLMDDLGFITGKHIVPVIASERAISAKIAECYGESQGRESDGAGRLPRAGKLRSIEEILRGLEEYTNDDRKFTSSEAAEENPAEADVSEGEESLHDDARTIEEESPAAIDKAVFDLTDSEPGDGGVSGSRKIEIEFPGASVISGFTAAVVQSEPLEIGVRTEESDDFSEPDKKFNVETSEAGINGVGETAANEISLPDGDSFAAPGDVDKPSGTDSAGKGITIPEEYHAPLAREEDSPGENGLYPVPETAEENQRIDDIPDAEEHASPEFEGGATLADKAVPSSDEKAKNGSGVKLPKGSILIVDHSPTVRRVVALALEREGYKVYAAGDGMQALAALNDITPGLILVDINLPHMDGYQLCKVIKRHGLTKDIPVVMLSGKVGMMDKVKGRMAGASDYITKPFAAGDIIGAAEKYLS